MCPILKKVTCLLSFVDLPLESNSLVFDMDETDFKREDLKVQLGQFYSIVLKTQIVNGCFCRDAYFRKNASDPAGIYLIKVNNRNTRTRCEICSKLIIKTPERRHWRRSGVFIVNFVHISHLVLVFVLLTLSR